MIKLGMIVAACAILNACANGGSTLNSPHAVAERAEDAAESAYQGTVAALSAAEGAGRLSTSVGDGYKVQAWNTLQQARSAYNAGQDIAPLVAMLQSDLTHAQAK